MAHSFLLNKRQRQNPIATAIAVCPEGKLRDDKEDVPSGNVNCIDSAQSLGRGVPAKTMRFKNWIVKAVKTNPIAKGKAFNLFFNNDTTAKSVIPCQSANNVMILKKNNRDVE
jgi:hypothetical protein